MSLEDKLAELYEYDSDIEGGERHKVDWIKYASNLLRESFPAPIEPVKDAMELATLISQRCHTKAAAWFDFDEAAALIQSSFEAWRDANYSEFPHGSRELDDREMSALLQHKPTPVHRLIGYIRGLCDNGEYARDIPRCVALLQQYIDAESPAPTDEKALMRALDEAESYAASGDSDGVRAYIRTAKALLSHESPKEQA